MSKCEWMPEEPPMPLVDDAAAIAGNDHPVRTADEVVAALRAAGGER